MKIDQPYLLITHIPCYARSDGQRAVDGLWQKDVVEHLQYLRRFTLAAPLASGPPPDHTLALPGSEDGVEFRHVDLVHSRSFGRALLSLPADVVRIWRAIGRAHIVHAGVAGWPIPTGWIAAPIAHLRGRFLIIVVESAPWRLKPGDRRLSGPRWRLRAALSGLRWRLRAALSERLARWCVGLADVSFFTHVQYRDSLLGRNVERGHVIPASWVDDHVILTDQQAEELWRTRLALPDKPLALVYAARLTADKGVLTLLEAMKLLDRQGIRVALDIIGSGELQHECSRLRSLLRGPASIRMRGTLAYGDSFFQALRPYHALVVPNLSDEQPRIVFDAWSQSLPPLASDTPGLRECIAHEVNGMLVPPGDPEALAAMIHWAFTHRDRLRCLGLAGLSSARNLTHQEMHRRRCRILLEMLTPRAPQRDFDQSGSLDNSG